jgi:hypothetical protein
MSPFKLKIHKKIELEETFMRTLLSIVAFSLIVAVAAPAFAGGTAACEKVHMKWDATAKKCS